MQCTVGVHDRHVFSVSNGVITCSTVLLFTPLAVYLLLIDFVLRACSGELIDGEGPGGYWGLGVEGRGERESVDALFVANIDGQDLNERWKSHGLLYSSSSTFGAPWINLRAVSGLYFLQCFGAVGWAAGRASGLYKTEWWGAGVVICLEQGCRLAYGPVDTTVTHCLLLQ